MATITMILMKKIMMMLMMAFDALPPPTFTALVSEKIALQVRGDIKYYFADFVRKGEEGYPPNP